MALVRPPILPVWADSGAKTQPSDAEIDIGWPLSSVPPSRQRFNWFFNYVMNGVRYLARRGLSDYDATETYSIGDRTIGSDNRSYTSLTNANIGNNPITPANQGVTWERWGYTKAELQAYIDNELATTALASIQFQAIADAVGAIPGANYTAGQSGTVSQVTTIVNPSATKRLRIFVITASCKVWNKGGNTAIVQVAGQLAFSDVGVVPGGGSFNTVSNSGTVKPDDERNGASQFNAGVTYTIPPAGSVDLTNRLNWAINSAGAINGGNSSLTSNILIVKFELP